MTAKEFGFLADAIKTYFPRDNVLPTEKAMKLWYSELKDIPYQLAHTALRKYVSTNKFAPTIADIREQVAELNNQNEEELNENAAWSIAWKAICNSGYHAEEEFEKLPPVIQRTVHSPAQLREWALLENIDGKTITVLQSDFQRAFRMEQQRDRERNKLSPDVLKLMKPMNNPQIEDKPKELGVPEQRMIAEGSARPAPDDLKERVLECFREESEEI